MRIPSNVKWLSFASFLADVSSEMTFPLLPLFMANVLGMTTLQIGLVEGIGLATVALAKLAGGYLSDRVGVRKPFVVVGYAIPTVSKILLAVSTQWWHMLLYRFLDRSGKGIRDPPRDALIAASGGKSVRGMFFGFHRAIDTLGAVLGVLLAMLVLWFFPGNYRAVFWLSMIPVVFASLSVARFVREKQFRVSKSRVELGVLVKQYWVLLLVGLFFGLASVSYSFMLLRSQSLGVAVVFIPLLYLVYNLCYAFGSYPAGVVSDALGRTPVLCIGFALFAVVALGFAFGLSPWLLMVVYGFSIALTDGVMSAFISDVAVPVRRASLIGLYHMVVGLAVLPAKVVFGFVSEVVSVSAAFWLVSLFAFAAASVLLFVPRQKHL